MKFTRPFRDLPQTEHGSAFLLLDETDYAELGALAARLAEADVFACRLAYRGDKSAQAYAEAHGYDWRHASNSLGTADSASGEQK
jgi:hypothetical protein